MSAFVLKHDQDRSAQPSHSAVPTLFASDDIWGATVYLHGKKIGSIARLYVNEKSGAIEQVEISRRMGRPQLFVRWEQLRFDPGLLKIHLISEVEELARVQRSFLQRLLTPSTFWILS